MSAADAIGYAVMVAGGLAVAAALLALAAMLVGVAGAWLWKRLLRTYHLSVLWYWLPQLEKRGTHIFKKPDGDGKPAP